MSRQSLDQFTEELNATTRASVYASTKVTHEKRAKLLHECFESPDELRKRAGLIKQHVLENLDTYLERAETKLKENGAQVHWATDGREACEIVWRLMQERGAKRMVKAKTMVSEEIELTKFLEEHGMEALETDLGEYIVQIDHDHPSHIVRPIIHKSRGEIARSFEANGLGAYNDDPEVITRRARVHLRKKFLEADVGLTGANFLSVESGRLVIVTNEGNARFCTAASRCHIALVGIEKLVPSDADLGLFLNLLARSATAQPITVYTEFIRGPRGTTQADGPEEMHVVFVDNGRSEILAGDCREILRCIRCGACMNVCPVYRQASGHAYRSVYPGPLGAVLSPLLAGKNFPQLADLPKASSLCGACNEVCPVNIPIPDLLLRLRDRGYREGAAAAKAGSPPMGAWAWLATHPQAWRAALKASGLANVVPTSWIPAAPVQAWAKVRTLPKLRGGKFRTWLAERRKKS
ncbi:LutB/LldF family L-lactate oxidation iron-sulfur protein [Nibricoccus sp. IMCC34717]|uniref:LutB/LldF family L-lactate oxidation iron-sulfur protein n=1 Tax=Nibricoccus sp. IMCC34717 TaxID=3034021 RepID=UPI00384E7523